MQIAIATILLSCKHYLSSALQPWSAWQSKTEDGFIARYVIVFFSQVLFCNARYGGPAFGWVALSLPQ